MEFQSIGEVAKTLDISVRTLRYYDQIGLVNPSKKDKHGKRYYDDQDILKLEKITILKVLNFSLIDIEKILSKISIQQILHAHKELLQKRIQEWNDSVIQLNTLMNIVNLEREIHWAQLIPLVKHKQEEAQEKNWNGYFQKEEKEILKSVLPKLEKDDSEIKKWININRGIELCLQKGSTPESEEGQIIAEDTLILYDELFLENEELGLKFWEARKSPTQSKALNLYPVKDEVLHFLEQVIQIFEIK